MLCGFHGVEVQGIWALQYFIWRYLVVAKCGDDKSIAIHASCCCLFASGGQSQDCSLHARMAIEDIGQHLCGFQQGASPFMQPATGLLALGGLSVWHSIFWQRTCMCEGGSTNGQGSCQTQVAYACENICWLALLPFWSAASVLGDNIGELSWCRMGVDAIIHNYRWCLVPVLGTLKPSTGQLLVRSSQM